MAAAHEHVVAAQAAGTRIDHYLVALAQHAQAPACIAGLSRSRLQALLRDGAIVIVVPPGSAAPRGAARRLRGNEILQLQVPPPRADSLQPQAMDLHILHEDGDMLALSKPAGLVVHAGAGVHGATLVQGLLAHCGDLSGIGGVCRPGIVHRLDRDTSGVLVVAKHDRAHRALAAQFAQRQVEKIYLAVAFGQVHPAAALLDTPYGRHPRRRQLFTARAELLRGAARVRRARTAYTTLAQAAGMTVLQVQLHTGRTHQIRVHLAERGHPLVGDSLYGGQGQAYLQHPLRAQLACLGQHALHAHTLRLRHPCTQAPLHLHAPLPGPLAALLQALGAPAAGLLPSSRCRG